MGMALRDHFGSDIWVKAMFARCAGYQYVIIPDVRFKNEADTIRERGGLLLRVEGDPTKARETDGRDLTHISEVDLDDYAHFDYRIANHGSLDDLRDQVVAILAQRAQ